MRRRRPSWGVHKPAPVTLAPMQAKECFGDAPELLNLLPAMPHATQAWSAWSAPERAAEYLSRTTERWHPAFETSDFYGNQSEADACNMVRMGWQEGAERVARIRDKINANRPHGPRLVRYDVAGAYPVVARAVAGNPLNMRRIDSAKLRRRPVITLVNHMGGIADVDAACFINKCAVVAAIVDAIESAGYSCHVLGVAMSSYGSHLAGTVFQVKQPGEHIDVPRLAYALGHVAMFRRVVFGLRSADMHNKGRLGGMGTTTDFPSSIDGVYVLPSMQVNAKKFATEEQAATEGLEYFLGELTKQGCPAFPSNNPMGD